MRYLENNMMSYLWDKIRRVFQTQTDNSLNTSSKTITGAINELQGDSLSNLKYISQTLTDAQRRQARANINAAQGIEINLDEIEGVWDDTFSVMDFAYPDNEKIASTFDPKRKKVMDYIQGVLVDAGMLIMQEGNSQFASLPYGGTFNIRLVVEMDGIKYPIKAESVDVETNGIFAWALRFPNSYKGLYLSDYSSLDYGEVIASVGAVGGQGTDTLIDATGAARYVYDAINTSIATVKPLSLNTEFKDGITYTEEEKQLGRERLGALSSAAGAVGTTNIADKAVTTAKIADNAINTAKIADGSITGDKFSPGLTLFMNQQFGYLKQVQIQYGEDPSAAIKSFAQRDNKTALYIKLTNGLLVPANTNGETASGLYSYGNTVRKVLFDGTKWSDVEIQNDIIDTAHIKDGAVTKSKLEQAIQDSLDGAVQSNKFSPVLREIDLTGTDAERKAKLDQFEKDWKALTGSDSLAGARFVGVYEYDGNNVDAIFMYDLENQDWTGVAPQTRGSETLTKAYISSADGSLTITPLFSHLEAITIYTDNNPEHMQANKTAIAAYEANLQELGVDTSKGYMIPVELDNDYQGFIMGKDATMQYTGIIKRNKYSYAVASILINANGSYNSMGFITEGYYDLTTTSKRVIPAINEVNSKATGLASSLEAITIKTSNSTEDKAANKAAIKAYVDNLKALGVDLSKGYVIPITEDSVSYSYGILIGKGETPRLVGYQSLNNTYTAIVVTIEGEVVDSPLQPRSSKDLTTTSKQIVGAINEVNGKIGDIDTILAQITGDPADAVTTLEAATPVTIGDTETTETTENGQEEQI